MVVFVCFPSCGCVLCVLSCVMLSGVFLCVGVCVGVEFIVFVWLSSEFLCAVLWCVFVCVVCLRVIV